MLLSGSKNNYIIWNLLYSVKLSSIVILFPCPPYTMYVNVLFLFCLLFFLVSFYFTAYCNKLVYKLAAIIMHMYYTNYTRLFFSLKLLKSWLTKKNRRNKKQYIQTPVASPSFLFQGISFCSQQDVLMLKL